WSRRLGAMRGAAAVAARFMEEVDQTALKATIEELMKDKAVACGEIWSAVSASEFPVSEEERLRGGDRKIKACLYVETLRVEDASRIAGILSGRFPSAAAGAYRLLCEVRSAGASSLRPPRPALGAQRVERNESFRRFEMPERPAVAGAEALR